MKTKILTILLLIVSLTSCELIFAGLIGLDFGHNSYVNNTVVTGFNCTVSDNNLNFSWNAVPGATSYRIYLYTSDVPNYAQLLTTEASPNGFLNNNNLALSIRPGVYYYWWVTCIINNVEGPKGDSLYKGAKIGKPSGLTCLEKTDSSAFLWWNKQTSEDGVETEYKITWKKAGSSGATTETSSTNYVEIKDLELNTEYEFYVQAKKEDGSWSEKSDVLKEITSTTETKFEVIEIQPNDTSVNLEGLNNNDIYLVNINSTDSIVASKNLRWIMNKSLSNSYSQEISEILYSRNLTALTEEEIETGKALAETMSQAEALTAEGKTVSGVYSNGLVRLEAEFPSTENIDISILSDSISRSTIDITDYDCTLGSSRDFFVIANNTLFLKQSILCAIGEYCYVWVAANSFDDNSMTSNDNLITTDQAENVQETFDMLYPYVTSVFGEKYQGSENDKYIEKKDKISIFIHDIDQDYEKDQISGVLGYFYSKDFLKEYIVAGDNQDYNISNQDELFYVDSHFTDCYEKMAMSTLAHEFQHMLRYVNKDMKDGGSSDVWCNEMGSLLCEELIQDKLEISDSDSPKNRLYQFCRDYYKDGLLDWTGESVDYSTAYAFGAWLVRNYGGVEFLNKTITTRDSYENPLFGTDLIETITGKEMKELLKEFIIPLTHQSMSEESAEEQGWKILNKAVNTTFEGYEYNFDAINLKLFNYYDNDGAVTFGLDHLPGDGNLVHYVSSGLESGAFTVQYWGKVGDSSSESTTLELNTIGSTSTGLSTYIIIQ